MRSLKKHWQKIVPVRLLSYIRLFLEPTLLRKLRLDVLKQYHSIDLKRQPDEIREGIKFLKSHRYTAYPFGWTLKYEKFTPEVYFDQIYSCFYSVWNGKKIYFPGSTSKTQAEWNTRSFIKEQDSHSPHLYLTDTFQVEEGSIIVDAGVAEGNFAISVIEKAKKIYLIECDPEWIQALKITFAPWKDKVVFVEKYLSDTVDQTSTTIDTLIRPESNEKYFIKMDVEGYEKKALAGMHNLISSGNPIKMCICTYHHPEDFTEIEGIMQAYNFKYHASNGYVLYSSELQRPAFRKTLLRAEK